MMIPPSEAVASQSASISIASSPEAVFDLVSDLPRMGEWSPESIGGEWIDGETVLTERWWIVNLSPALADMTPQQLQARVDITLGSIQQTLAPIKASAEA